MTESFRAEVLKILGQNLRKIRIDKKLTTADVALHCDLSLKSINEEDGFVARSCWPNFRF